MHKKKTYTQKKKHFWKLPILGVIKAEQNLNLFSVFILTGDNCRGESTEILFFLIVSSHPHQQ